MDLKAWLKRNNISVKTLADHLGISTVYVYNHMRGDAQFSFDLCKKIEELTKGEIKAEEIIKTTVVYCDGCGRKISASRQRKVQCKKLSTRPT